MSTSDMIYVTIGPYWSLHVLKEEFVRHPVGVNVSGAQNAVLLQIRLVDGVRVHLGLQTKTSVSDVKGPSLAPEAIVLTNLGQKISWMEETTVEATRSSKLSSTVIET